MNEEFNLKIDDYDRGLNNGQLVMKQKVLSIVQGQLESVKEARKDTTGLGMIEHVIKMILFEVERL